MQKALTQYGCPKQIVSDNGSVFKAHLLERAIDRLGIDWHNIEKGKPWQNLMESHFSIEYCLLDSYAKASVDLKDIQRQHGRFIDEYNISGHWHHKAYTEDGRIYYKSPQTILGLTELTLRYDAISFIYRIGKDFIASSYSPATSDKAKSL